MGKPKASAAASVQSPLKKALDASVVDAKKKKRKTQQARAGLEISVARCRRSIVQRWKGNVSAESAVAMAAMLQFIHTLIITGAAESASKGLAAGTDGQRRISSGDVQTGVSNNAWLRRDLIKGRVIGAAPNTVTITNAGTAEDK